MTTTTFYSRMSPEDKQAAKDLAKETGKTLAEVLAAVMTEAEKTAQ